MAELMSQLADVKVKCSDLVTENDDFKEEDQATGIGRESKTRD
jgi:hypothetical protein